MSGLHMMQLRSKVCSVCPCLWQRTLLYRSDQVACWLLAQRWEASLWVGKHCALTAKCVLLQNVCHDWSYECTTAMQRCCLSCNVHLATVTACQLQLCTVLGSSTSKICGLFRFSLGDVWLHGLYCMFLIKNRTIFLVKSRFWYMVHCYY